MAEACIKTSQTPQLSILIVGYNTKDLVADCLRGLYEHTQGVDFEVLFVDCSDDGSAQMLARDFPQVRVIDNKENLGFGRGNNFVAKHACGDRILLLNPDTLVNDNAIGELNTFADSQPDAGAWGGLTILPDGRIDPGCQQTGPGLWYALYRLFGLKSLGTGGLPEDATQPGEVAVLSGAYMMVRREVWEHLGGFDESFFMYCEETDLCMRIKRASYRLWMNPNSRITHLVGSGASDSPNRMLAMCKGAMHMDRKHFGSLHVCCEGLLRWVHSLTRYAAGVLLLLIKPAKSASLRDKHRSIVFEPKQWWGGWPTQAEGNASLPETDKASTAQAVKQGDAA